jgi:hypothetical protein
MAPFEEIANRAEVDRFILERIDTVPHLEALLLLWQHSFERWSVENVARRLWIEPEEARAILQDLIRLEFASLAPGDLDQYAYQPSASNDRLMRGVEVHYRREMIRISRMIHAKPSSAVRAFARAFRFKKGRG